ncbi:MAG: hypothetical protein ABUL60_33350 [Myxococcales bacterium]
MDYQTVLRADCARCQALCCVSLPFDRGDSFAFDKPANQPCPELQLRLTCGIHEQLRVRGQAGCADYDCYGAGQRITQELFPGVSWQRQPEARPLLFEAFRRLKRVHELRLLLHAAGRLQLSPPKADERERLLARLEPERFSVESLLTLDLCELEAASRSWLRGLSRELSPEQARRRLPLLPPS